MTSAQFTDRFDATELATLAALAVEVAVAAGDFIMAARPEDLAVATKTSTTDVVTVMDRDAEQRIRQRLEQARPHDSIFGEEGGAQPAPTDAGQHGSGVTWVVDPIDGTVNYLYRLPAFAVSVAAVTGNPAVPGGWSPLAGAVYNPSTGEVFHARLGGGAALRRLGEVDRPDQSLQVNSQDELSQCLVATGFSYSPQVRRQQAEVLVEVLPQVRDIRRFGSAALDLCAVAAGRVDAYYERGLNPWDVAAGWLIVTEAGGLVTGWRGGQIGDPGAVAGPPLAHAQLLGLLDSALPGS